MEEKDKYRYGDVNKYIDNADVAHLDIIFKRQPELLCDEYKGDYDTPLHYCAKYGSLEVCKYLHNKGLDVNISLKRDETPLDAAATNNRIEIAEWLLKNGAFVDGLDTSILTPMMSAITFNHIKMVKLLVEHGANVNRMHIRNGKLPLDIAFSRGYKEIAEYLKAKGGKSQYIRPDWIDDNSEGNGILGCVTLSAGKILPVDILTTKDIALKLAFVNNAKNRMLFTFGLFKLQNPMIELFIVLPEYWNFYDKKDENQFPVHLLLNIYNLIKKGLKIEEGHYLLAKDINYSTLSWPDGIAGFYTSNVKWKSKNSEIDDSDEVMLLTLVPIKKIKNGFAPQSIEKNRTVGWTKLTLRI